MKAVANVAVENKELFMRVGIVLNDPAAMI
jgi:hypothetical protein